MDPLARMGISPGRNVYTGQSSDRPVPIPREGPMAAPRTHTTSNAQASPLASTDAEHGSAGAPPPDPGRDPRAGLEGWLRRRSDAHRRRARRHSAEHALPLLPVED